MPYIGLYVALCDLEALPMPNHSQPTGGLAAPLAPAIAINVQNS
jgi:hypothetical protein